MFQEIKKQSYIVVEEEVDNIDTFVRDLINRISLDSVGIYNDILNDKLYEAILSRYIASLFINEHSGTLNNIHHCVIKITINNNNYNITVGNFKTGEDLKYLNGITIE